jgi:hypothetical protein
MTKRKAPEDKLKVGRRTSYRPEFCEILLELAAEGMWFCEIAAHLNVCDRTLYNWAYVDKDKPEFLLAYTRARTLQLAWIVSHIRKHLVSSSDVRVNDKLYSFMFLAGNFDMERRRALNLSGLQNSSPKQMLDTIFEHLRLGEFSAEELRTLVATVKEVSDIQMTSDVVKSMEEKLIALESKQNE